MAAYFLAQDGHAHEEAERSERVDDLAAASAVGDELHVAHFNEYFLVLGVPDKFDQSRQVKYGFAVRNADETLACDQHLYNLLPELGLAALGDQFQKSHVESSPLEVGHQFTGDFVGSWVALSVRVGAGDISDSICSC